MDKQEIQKIVNPVYTTAKGTVLMLAAAGDKDAAALLPYVGVDEIQNKQAPPEEIRNCYKIAQQARYEINNKAALMTEAPVIVDLPSGYSPRGFRVTSAGRQYLGCDLPVVIDVMKTVEEKTMTPEQRSMAKYCAVDATNYDSIKAALGNINGELCIVTEGLLGYFNEPELVSICQAIHCVLSEYGGTWITSDASILQIYSLTFATVLKGDQAEFMQHMKGKASSMADVDFYKNSLFLNGTDDAVNFLKNQGFGVKREAVTRYLEDLPGVDPKLMNELREAYSVMEMWTLTAASAGNKIDKDLPFAVESEFRNGKFTAKIQGRMDTITAPELLEKFQQADGVKKIEINVEKMEYISSAGLRVLLMMCKSLKKKSLFKLVGVNDEVRGILEVTGFDQFLL